MFFGKKKTQLEKMIDEKGIDTIATQLAILIQLPEALCVMSVSV
jgi:hypothetical protein